MSTREEVLRELAVGDEPFLVLRARDTLAVPMMEAYASTLASAAGFSPGKEVPERVRAYRVIADALEWQAAHRDLLRPGD